MVLLFWLDLSEIFFLAIPGFELGTSVSVVLHSTTMPGKLLVFISDNFRYLTLVQRIGGGIVLIGPVRDFLFGHTRVWTWKLWISSPAHYHCTTATSGFHLWQFQVFNSGAEGLVVVLFWLDLSEIFFLATPGFEPQTSGSLVLHSTTVPQQHLVFISDNFRYLTLVQRDWWWYYSVWTCERFSFFTTPGFETRTSGSLFLHSTTVSRQLLVFISDNFRYLTLVQRDWWWYCSDWTCQRFSFWPHQALNPGPLDL